MGSCVTIRAHPTNPDIVWVAALGEPYAKTPDSAARMEDVPVPLRTRRAKPQRVRASDRFYAELAMDYAAMCVSSRHPTQSLATKRGQPITKIRSWINLARRNDFLTQTTRGASGGALPEKAKRVLAAPPMAGAPSTDGRTATSSSSRRAPSSPWWKSLSHARAASASELRR